MRRFGPDPQIIPSHTDRDPIEFGSADFRIVRRRFPICGLAPNVIEHADHRVFDIRFYLPHRDLAARRGRIRRALILVNGLDEYQSFKLYHEVGAFMASRGLACVLLPLPDHLNRHWKFRHCKPGELPKEPTTDEEEREERPSHAFRKEPETLYRRFLQFAEELEILCKHLRGECHSSGTCREREFYGTWFAPDLRISILGFSLGGLAALATFLLQPDTFSSAIMLNSGVSLDRIVLPDRMFTREEWRTKVVTPLKRWFTDGLATREKLPWGVLPERLSQELPHLFTSVLLGSDGNAMRERLKKADRKLLFVSGGADRVMQAREVGEWAEDAHGLHTITVPGVDHFLALSHSWSKWNDLAWTHIYNFETHAASDPWHEDDCVHELAELNILANYCVTEATGFPDTFSENQRRRWQDLWEVAGGLVVPGGRVEDWVSEETLMILRQRGLGDEALATTLRGRLALDAHDENKRFESYLKRRKRIDSANK